jgi:F-box interacting protein
MILNGRDFFRFTLVASCNGLLCFSDHILNIIYLWNPATSDTPKSLPLHPRHPFHLFQNPHGLQLDTVGFGFDRRSNDFKVLSISHVRDYDDSTCYFNDTAHFQPKVYSLSTGTWRQLLDLRVPFEHFEPFPNFPTTEVDGIFFWWAVVIDLDIDVLLIIKIMRKSLLSTSTTSCSEQRRSWTVHIPHYSSFDLTVLNGCLTIMGFPFEERRSRSSGLVIWVLFEFGVKESWTKLMNLPLSIENPGRPLGLWKNRELIIQNAKGQLILYNLLTHTKKEVVSTHRNTLPSPVFPLQAFPYTSSNSMRQGRVELE